MLDSRSVNVDGFLSSPSRAYLSKITVYRLVQVGTDFSGRGGTPVDRYKRMVKNYPASIPPTSAGSLGYTEAGETAISPFIIRCPYKRFRDGTLIIMERDLIIDTLNNQNAPFVYEAMFSRDAMNNRVEILVDAKFGTVTYKQIMDNLL